MRSREEIFEGLSEARADCAEAAQDAFESAVLEVLLDIRDKLTKPQEKLREVSGVEANLRPQPPHYL